MGRPITRERIVKKDHEGLKNELSQSMTGSEKERLKQERVDLVSEFGRVLGMERIDDLTLDMFKEFIVHINQRCTQHDVPLDMTRENFDQVRRNLRYFLYGSDPIETRINAVMISGPLRDHPLKIEGFHRSGSLLLNLMDGNYCIWNDKTQDVLLKYHLVQRTNDSWKMYKQNLNVQTRLCDDLGIDLYYLDYLLKKIG